MCRTGVGTWLPDTYLVGHTIQTCVADLFERSDLIHGVSDP